MKKLRPPKRKEQKSDLDEENARFFDFIAHHGQQELVQRFKAETHLYLRGRGSSPPCGYLYLSEGSFKRWHRPIAFFDPMIGGTPYVTFRLWKGEFPFDEIVWNRLRQDRVQDKENMRSIDLVSEPAIAEAIRLTNIARKTFDDRFDLSIWLD